MPAGAALVRLVPRGTHPKMAAAVRACRRGDGGMPYPLPAQPWAWLRHEPALPAAWSSLVPEAGKMAGD